MDSCHSCTAFVLPSSKSPLQKTFRRQAQRYPHMCMSTNNRSRGDNFSFPEQLSRRLFLLTSAFSASFLLHPPPHAGAYSSPYKPGQKTEQQLPDRLYEEATRRVVATPSGLRYFDLLPGTGAEAAEGSTVSIYYTSRLGGLNGVKISSSYDDPTAPPLVLRLGEKNVVPGVSEALAGMKVGGKRRAVLPPSIGYKTADMQPAVKEFFARRRLLSVLETNRDATIVFDLELVKVK